MAGTKVGGLRAAATNKARYGKNFYADIGRKGGVNGHTGGFAANRELARIAGAKGGKISARGVSSDVLRGENDEKSIPLTVKALYQVWLDRCFRVYNHHVSPDGWHMAYHPPKKEQDYYLQVAEFVGNADEIDGYERAQVLMGVLYEMHKKHPKDLSLSSLKQMIRMAIGRVSSLGWTDCERAYQRFKEEINKEKR